MSIGLDGAPIECNFHRAVGYRHQPGAPLEIGREYGHELICNGCQGTGDSCITDQLPEIESTRLRWTFPFLSLTKATLGLPRRFDGQQRLVEHFSLPNRHFLPGKSQIIRVEISVGQMLVRRRVLEQRMLQQCADRFGIDAEFEFSFSGHGIKKPAGRSTGGLLDPSSFDQVFRSPEI